MVVTDLLFGKYLDDAPQGRIYRLATVEEVTLLRPMVLEIAKPAESVTVMMLEEGVWTEQTIPNFDTTRVEITHFSANLVAVYGKGACPVPVNGTLSEPEAAAWAALCPGPGAPAQASTDQASTDQGSTDDSATTRTPAAAAPPATSAPSTSGSSQPAPAETAASNQGCQSPKVELERNGSKSCVTEAVCLSVGFGWSFQNGKCTGPPPCEGESLGHYSRDNAGVCISPMYGCAHPKLDYPHLNGCITRHDCGPSSDGYTIKGSTCEFYEGDCYFGYVWNGHNCVTLSMGCEYPKVEFVGQGHSSCATTSECEAYGTGHYYSDGKCYAPEEVYCESGYFYDGSRSRCVTPGRFCFYPNVEFIGQGQQTCVSPSECEAIDGGGWYTDTGLCLKA